MSIGKIRNLGVGGGTVKPLYLVKDNKPIISVLSLDSYAFSIDEYDGYAQISCPRCDRADGRFAIAIDGKKYHTVHITYYTTDYRDTLNRIGVTTSPTARNNEIPANISYQTWTTSAWALTPNVDNYIGFRIYVSDATAVIRIKELYVD